MSTSLVTTTKKADAETRLRFAQEWAGKIKHAFDTCNSVLLSSVRKAIAAGALMNHVKCEGKKTGVIPHGEFGPWLETHVKEVPVRSVQSWMSLASDASEFLQIRNNCVFENGGHLAIYDALTLPDTKLTPPLIDLRTELLEHLQGKTQKRLALEWRSDTKPEHHPRKPMTAEEQLAAEADTIEAMANTALVAIHALCSEEENIARQKPLKKHELYEAGVLLNNLLRKFQGRKQLA